MCMSLIITGCHEDFRSLINTLPYIVLEYLVMFTNCTGHCIIDLYMLTTLMLTSDMLFIDIVQKLTSLALKSNASCY